MNRPSCLTERDTATIKAQISARDVNARDVAYRCVYGHPAVILLNHKKSGSDGVDGIDCMSASNPLWLTCPYLNDVIHEFENRGYIKKLEAFIYSDDDLARSMDDSHVNFYYLRKHVCGDIVSANPQNQRLMRIFNSGVGGIRSLTNLKCLHLHYAHYLVNGTNPAGFITGLMLRGKLNCHDERCAHA
jgi:hypothetical protein